jgi:hypothetical protein
MIFSDFHFQGIALRAASYNHNGGIRRYHMLLTPGLQMEG